MPYFRKRIVAEVRRKAQRAFLVTLLTHLSGAQVRQKVAM
jgi:hypothetical protein